MNIPNTRKYPLGTQYLISIGLVILVATASYYSVAFIDFRVVALLLLMTVSINAMLFDIMPVLIAAVLSAITWNYFFIPPIHTFQISTTADLLMFLLYFIIALVNAVLTFKIRVAENKARDKEEKEHTIKLYNTLLNSLSHELRTPIATIIGAVDNLSENKENLSEENQQALLEEINKASIRLNRQVENLLSMSRLESGMLKPKMDWCDLNEIIFSLIQKTSGNNPNRIHFLPNEKLPLFKLDGGFMEQVIQNLLHNAIRYTPEEAEIWIEIRGENDACILTISDNGEGFPESEINHVFEKFYRLPNSKAGGSGLGLSIVKGLVEAQKGSVQLKNQTNGGALFIISIPCETSFLNNLKNE